MLDMFKSIIEKVKAKPADAPRVDSELELQIATCALLLEMAHADDDCTPDEEEHIAGMMQRRFGISRETFEDVRLLADQRRREQIDLWGFTSILKQHFTHAQKMQVMEMLWSVIYADDRLADYEDYLVHKLAKLLDIDHGDMIAAKVKVLEAAKKGG